MEYIYSNKPLSVAAQYAAATILDELAVGKKVLWLVSGGSGIPIAVDAAKLLDSPNLYNLSITLTDERFGAVGHKDENWQQLLDAGFKVKGAVAHRILTGESIAAASADYAKFINKKLTECDFSIGIFGMGADGHTAGLKPGLPNTYQSAQYYKADDYERITISESAISRLSEAVLQVSGEQKRAILREFFRSSTDTLLRPAEILKTLPKLTIYSNIKEEEL